MAPCRIVAVMRAAHSLTLNALGARLATSATTISQIENGVRVPSEELVQQLVLEFGLPARWYSQDLEVWSGRVARAQRARAIVLRQAEPASVARAAVKS